MRTDRFLSSNAGERKAPPQTRETRKKQVKERDEEAKKRKTSSQRDCSLSLTFPCHFLFALSLPPSRARSSS